MKRTHLIHLLASQHKLSVDIVRHVDCTCDVEGLRVNGYLRTGCLKTDFRFRTDKVTVVNKYKQIVADLQIYRSKT